MADSTEIWEDWNAEAASLRQRHDAPWLCEDAELRELAGELWCLLDDAPDELKTAYKGLHEHELADHQAFQDALIEGQLVWALSADRRESALSIGRQLRSLDAILAHSWTHESLPNDVEMLRCTRSGILLIPMSRAKPADARKPGPSNGFLRRAFLHHRVLPKTTRAGKSIEAKFDKHLLAEGYSGSTARLGASLFPGVLIAWQGIPNSSRVKEVTVPGERGLLKSQIDGAYSERVLAAVWPELCMPPKRVKQLAKGLKTKAAELVPGVGPLLVAAGSWHEEVDGQIHNVMHILDHSGREAWTFTKITQFVGGGLVEANTPGDIIRVLVTRDLLISFAICSDFCDTTADLERPFLELDVDILLVASLGSEIAAVGHQDNLRARSNTCGGKTFVVHQREPSENGSNVGWVVSQAKDLSPPVENSPWSVREISLK